jgi:hypothetical protein
MTMDEAISQVIGPNADTAKQAARVASNAANDLAKFTLPMLTESHVAEVNEILAPLADQLRAVIAGLEARAKKG